MASKHYNNPRAFAERRETRTIPKPFDKEELNALRFKYAEMAMQLAALKEEKKEYDAEWKNRNDPVKAEAAETLMMIKTGMIDIEMELNVIASEETETMDYVNDDGEVVYSRPMFPEERKQFRLYKPTVEASEAA